MRWPQHLDGGSLISPSPPRLGCRQQRYICLQGWTSALQLQYLSCGTSIGEKKDYFERIVHLDTNQRRLGALEHDNRNTGIHPTAIKGSKTAWLLLWCTPCLLGRNSALVQCRESRHIWSFLKVTCTPEWGQVIWKSVKYVAENDEAAFSFLVLCQK